MEGEAADAQEDRSADEAEAAVDKAPVERDAADGAGDQREEEDADGAEDAPGDDPAVADGVDVGADEDDRNDDVCEGEPVGAVAEEGEAGVRRPTSCGSCASCSARSGKLFAAMSAQPTTPHICGVSRARDRSH